MTDDDDLALIRRLDGIFTGLLSVHELEVFHRCCEAGTAMRSYEGPAAMLGLSKVRIVESTHVQ